MEALSNPLTKSYFVQPCAAFAILGSCSLASECLNPHLEPRELSQELFENRLFLLSQIVNIIEKLDLADKIVDRRAWCLKIQT